MRKTILIIDDDPVIIEVTRQMLMPQYTVLTANNGYDGTVTASEQPIDLILLDIMMPDMDGLSVLTLLQDNPKTKNIPVIMITSVSKKETIVTSCQMGVKGYIIKPFKEEMLLEKIKEILGEPLPQ